MGYYQYFPYDCGYKTRHDNYYTAIYGCEKNIYSYKSELINNFRSLANKITASGHKAILNYKIEIEHEESPIVTVVLNHLYMVLVLGYYKVKYIK